MSLDRRVRRLEVVSSPTVTYGWAEIVKGEYDAEFRKELARLVAEGLAKPSASLQRCYESLIERKISRQSVAYVPLILRGEEDA